MQIVENVTITLVDGGIKTTDLHGSTQGEKN
jgi:hypothetical protein